MPYRDYNPKMKEYMKRRYHDRRRWAIDLLGGNCKDCGTDENLNFDHIDATTKYKTFAKIWCYSKEKLVVELKKLQLLCQSCHIKKSKRCGDYRRRNK